MKYYLGYIELQGKRKPINWVEIIGSILFGIFMLLITFGLLLI